MDGGLANEGFSSNQKAVHGAAFSVAKVEMERAVHELKAYCDSATPNPGR